MLRLPTALLRHTTRQGSHYDWLMGDPTDPTGRLWTARVGHPPPCWRELGVVHLQQQPAHRRHYLTHQGSISGGRGQVRPVARGHHLPWRWTGDHIFTDLYFERIGLRLGLTRLAGHRWRAVVLASLGGYT